MTSKVFVDRPRLAVVIAIVMTIAGLVSLRQIPVAQFPDIVPPQLPVTAFFPGASAEVVEATIAEPIESQVNGVGDAQMFGARDYAMRIWFETDRLTALGLTRPTS